jgi:hypothetical protein
MQLGEHQTRQYHAARDSKNDLINIHGNISCLLVTNTRGKMKASRHRVFVNYMSHPTRGGYRMGKLPRLKM